MNSGFEKRKVKKEKMLSWSLDKKIKHAKKRIRQFYKELDGKVYIAFSGGKDSVVLKHLVKSLYPDVPSVFSNTTNEYLEILDFIREYHKDTIWVNPKKTFIDIMKTDGFPLVSKKVSRGIRYLKKGTTIKNKNHHNLLRTGITADGKKAPSFKIAKKWLFLENEDFNITEQCCDILKKEPLHRYQRETGRFPYQGAQMKESGTRELNWITFGCNIISDKTKVSRPLSIWTEDDIWEYIRLNNLPYSSIYDDVLDQDGNVIVKGEKRTGCAYCGFGANLEKGDDNRFKRLSIRKPKQFEKMMNLKNNGVTFREALKKVEVDI